MTTFLVALQRSEQEQRSQAVVYADLDGQARAQDPGERVPPQSLAELRLWLAPPPASLRGGPQPLRQQLIVRGLGDESSRQLRVTSGDRSRPLRQLVEVGYLECEVVRLGRRDHEPPVPREAGAVAPHRLRLEHPPQPPQVSRVKP